MNLKQLQNTWTDTPESHVHLNDLFRQLTDADPQLKFHRDWSEGHVWGMGERSFHSLWKILVDEMPEKFQFVEIGVHKAQILSLIRILADRTKKDAVIMGITPMNGADTGWTEDNYEADIRRIHDEFNLKQPGLFKGYSQDKQIIETVAVGAPFDIIYIDGLHTYDGCYADLFNYAPMVKKDGYLVIDDAMCDGNFPPSGYFTGILDVTLAKKDYMAEFGEQWEFVANIVHLVVYRRK